MRILKTSQLYYPYLDKGGPPAKIRGLARALAGRGHQITVLTADRGQSINLQNTNEWIRSRKKTEWGWEWLENEIRTIYLPTIMNYRATTINAKLLKFCLKQLGDFEIAHIYGLYDVIGAVVASFCRRKGIPYIIEPLGMFQPRVRSFLKKRLYHLFISDSFFRNCAKIVVTAENERKELLESGIPAGKISVRRNGLDLDEFQARPHRGQFRRRFNVRESQLLVFFLGRISFIKGLDLLIEAFSHLTSDCVLVIAGPDDKDGCREKLNEMIKSFGLEDRVVLVRALFGDEKCQAFVDADLFVLPSRYESFGNAAAEAIAFGTPVLITDQCGIAPMIDRRAGLSVECSAAGIRAGLQFLLTDHELRCRFASACSNLAGELSWDQPVTTMEQIYSSIISSVSPSSIPALPNSQPSS